MSSDDVRRWLAAALVSVVALEAAAAVVGTLTEGLTFAAARDSFLVSNATLGTAYATCGFLVAAHRPRHRLGWLLLGAGVAQAGTAAVTPWFVAAVRDGASETTLRLLATAYSAAWPWAIALFLPLTLLVFPDGRPLGRAGRLLVPVVVVNAVVQVLLFSSDPRPLAPVADLGPAALEAHVSWLSVPALAGGGPVFVASDVVLSLAYLAGVAGLVVRYRRGDERTRLQVLWPLLGATVALAVIAAERLGGPVVESGFPILLTVTIALVPVGMTVAVLRHRLLDIRVVWSRTLTYLLLTAAAVAVYAGLVEVGSRLVGGGDARSASVVATLLVAVGFDPVRVRLRRGVDRLFYGERHDPVRAVSSVTGPLADGVERTTEVPAAVCRALRLPWAALAVDGRVLGEHGVRPDRVESIPLRHDGRRVGDLRVGIRSGESGLDPRDRAVLELMALPIGVAVRAEALADVVERSRREIVAAREEERGRIRRDLHDGLASVLTGVAFQADAVVALATDPERVTGLAHDIRTGVTGAIADVRRLINELYPAALHDLGLVEAVRRHAARLGPAVTIRADGVGALPAAVEVAAYRIVTEALTNAARHAGATRVEVTIAGAGGAGELVVAVDDDGPGASGAWAPGVGLRSMAERAHELGGSLDATPTPGGGRVRARLPVVPAATAVPP